MAAGVVRIGQAMQPVINLLRDHLLDSDLIYGDETTVQVLEEYVRQVGVQNQIPVNDSLPALERFERDRAVRLSNASVGLEGFKLELVLAGQQQQYVDGDIGLDELLRMNGMAPEPGYPAA